MVVKVVSAELSEPKSDITIDLSFYDNLHADSLKMVEVVMGLETEFQIEINFDEIEEMVTVADAVYFVENKRSKSRIDGNDTEVVS